MLPAPGWRREALRVLRRALGQGNVCWGSRQEGLVRSPHIGTAWAHTSEPLGKRGHVRSCCGSTVASALPAPFASELPTTLIQWRPHVLAKSCLRVGSCSVERLSASRRCWSAYSTLGYQKSTSTSRGAVGLGARRPGGTTQWARTMVARKPRRKTKKQLRPKMKSPSVSTPLTRLACRPRCPGAQSFKGRFKSTKNGIRMTRAFRSHNAKSKSPKQRRQLRRTKMLSSGLAKVMRRLGL
eukprot:scaffold258_cov354-Prasinococcus_capsulatus_cf.AAC.7